MTGERRAEADRSGPSPGDAYGPDASHADPLARTGPNSSDAPEPVAGDNKQVAPASSLAGPPCASPPTRTTAPPAPPPPSEAEFTPAVTLGHNVKQPQGRRHYLKGDLALSVGCAIAGHRGAEAWWSPHTWQANRRDGKRWQASIAVVVDIDSESHGVLKRNVGEKLIGQLNGVANLAHLTPHGVRAVFVFEGRVADRALFKQAAHGASALIEAAIKEAGAEGLEIDPGPTADVARLFFAPNASVTCRHKHAECTDPNRSAEVLMTRELPWLAIDLAEIGRANGAPREKRTDASSDSSGANLVSSFLVADGFKQKGKDIYFTCPQRDHRDENPSARFNPADGLWYCDVCRVGGEWRKLAKSLGLKVPKRRAAAKPKRGKPPLQEIGGRTRIVYRTLMGDRPLHEVVPMAVAEVAKKCADSVYTRGSHLVRATAEPASPIKKLDRGSGVRIGQIPDGALREILGAAVQWAAERENKKGVYEVETWAPGPILQAVRDRGQWEGVRPLTGVIEAPTVRPDGSLIIQPGYDAITGLLYVPHDTYPTIPDHPTEKEASSAFDTLLSPFREFPFQTDTDRASIVALMLTIAARSWIQGCAPHWVVMAPTFGAGKSLLVLAASKAMTGVTPDFMAPVGGRESDAESEMRKRLTTLLLEAPRVCVIDNLPDGATFESKSFAALLTSTRWKDRILGKSESVSLPHDIVWTSTGCNVSLWGDLARRSLSIMIDPEVEDPHLRAFETPDLRKLVSDEHPKLLCAALTIIRGFIAAGMPKHGLAPLGMFESWDSRVRAAVIWATSLSGGTPLDPLDSAARLQKDAPDRVALTELLAAWHALLPEEAPVTARRIVELCTDDARLCGAVISIGAAKNGAIDARSLGNKLRTLAGQVRGGFRLQKFDTLQGTARWKVTSSGGTRGSRGSAAGSSDSNCTVDPDATGEDQGELSRHHENHESHGSHDAPSSDPPSLPGHADERRGTTSSVDDVAGGNEFDGGGTQ